LKRWLLSAIESLEGDVERILTGWAGQLSLARAGSDTQLALAVRALNLGLDNLSGDYKHSRAGGTGQLYRSLVGASHDHGVAVGALHLLRLEGFDGRLMSDPAYCTTNLALYLTHSRR